MRNFANYDVDIHGKSSGVLKTICKKCLPTRKNKRDRSLRVNVDTGHCHCYHCGADFYVPDDVEELLSIDMGCVGEGLECTEHQVSICVKDSHGPYNYDVTSRFVELAKKHNLDYALDVYPFYGSDADAALDAGYDLRHGLIGAGVYASHGYERSHVDLSLIHI